MSGFSIIIDSFTGISHRMAKERGFEMIASTDMAYEQLVDILREEENVLFLTTSIFYKDRFHELQDLIERLDKEWKNRRVFLIDAKCLPVGTLTLAEQASIFRNLGMLVEEAYHRLLDMVDIVQEVILLQESHFSNENLYLQKNYNGFWASLFHHRPLVSLDKEGRFVQIEEARGYDEGRIGILNILETQINHYAMEGLSLYVGYVGREEEAKILSRRLESIYPYPVKMVEMSSLMEEVLGKQALGVFFLGKE